MRVEWWFTHLGDLFVAAAVGCAIVVWIWLNLNRLVGMAFGVCFSGTFALVTLIKLWTSRNLPQPDHVPLWALSAGAPSGHAALAGMVYGGAAAIFLKATRGPLAVLGGLASVAAVTLVAITRVTLRTHSAADVAAGLAVAGIFIAIFAAVLKAQVKDRDATPLALGISMAVVAAIAMLSHIRLSSDQFL